MRATADVRRAALAIALSLVTRGAGAQVRASERASVSQTVDGTVLTIDYSRPRVRGRAPLFGKVVTWGEVWTPGANWATTLQVNRDVRLDGRAVPAGRYSMWFVVRPGQWTMVLDPRFERYHADPPDSTAQQIRWPVTPRAGAFTEALTWSVPDVRPDGGTLAMQWDTVRVTLDLAVTPKHPLTVARSVAEPYLGRWVMTQTPSPGETAKPDTLELYYEDGAMKQRFSRIPDWYRSLQNSTMVWINDDWFIPTIIRNGKVLEMVADMVYEFDRKNGRATTFELRDDKDALLGHGVRLDHP